MLQTSTIKFLTALKKNNNKPWFDANRKNYEAAKADFIGFIQQVIDRHGKKDAAINHLAAKDCLFRINRDIRFAKDKSPYKSHFGAAINRGGRQSITTAGYYFHLEPGGTFTGGGIWMPEPDYLRKIRQEIDYNFASFKKILEARSFKKIYGDLSHEAEYKLTRVPKGYEADNEAADFLKLKSFIATLTIKDTNLGSPDLLKKTVQAFEALQPLIEFLNQSLSDE